MPTSWLSLRTLESLLGALALGSAAAAQTPASVWTIPGTVNAGGLNNTRFVSDLAVTNPGSLPAQATISLIPANGTTPKQVTLSAGQTVVYRNVLDSLWGAQGAGATQVSSGSPLLIRARTYNTAASGTYGVALPVSADDRLLVPGQTAHSLWVSQSANGSNGFRTNIAVAFPDAGGGAATVTVFDADGNEAGSQDYSLDAAGFQQVAVGSFAGAVSVARAELQVTRGRVAGYSVVVDNVTGDSSLFSFEELPSGYQDVVVNGVARANGRNNTFFRTDGRFFNPTDEDATVKASFHASGPSNPSPVTRTFTVGAGRILDVVDVLDTLLGLPVGSAGAVRFETDSSVGILCRTSNVDPFGVVPGTFGAQQKPTPLLSFLMSADAGAVITGIRQGATFRTNVGFAAGADGAGYDLTLKSAAGATISTAAGSLGAFGWTQPNVQDLFPTITIPDDATLQVKVTSGSVDVFDSSIDNASGDPVVTPIMPLPVAIPSSATIGPLGGSVRSDDGRMTLKIPAGALSAPAAVALTLAVSGDANALGPAYALTPSLLPLAKSALLVFRAAGGPAPELGLVTVSLAVKTGSGTFVAMGGRVDPAAGTLTVPIPSTNPSANAGETSSRVALDAATFLEVLGNQTITPRSPLVVTDHGVTFGIAQKLPPSAGGPDVRYLSSAEERDFTVRWTRPSRGTIDNTTGKIVLYRAPHRIRWAMDYASLLATIRVSGPDIALRYVVNAGIFIVRRNWRIETEVVVEQPCLFFYQLGYFWKEQGTFSIGDDLKITKNSAAVAQTSNPSTIWHICNGIPHGYTTITPTGDFDVDVQFESLNGGPLSFLDADARTLVLYGYSAFKGGTATLTGPQASPFLASVGDFSLGFTFNASPYDEGVWFDGIRGQYVTTHRHRIVSIDTP